MRAPSGRTTSTASSSASGGRSTRTSRRSRRSSTSTTRPRRTPASSSGIVPGLQAAMRALLAEATAARVVPRPGWCSAGVHVFPAGGALARDGGVIHFDTEGLTEEHVARRAPALSIVAMLQPADAGGGLRLWPVMYCTKARRGRTGRRRAEIPVRGRRGDDPRYDAGDVVIFDSYRLHQIQPIRGSRTIRASRPRSTARRSNAPRGRAGSNRVTLQPP